MGLFEAFLEICGTRSIYPACLGTNTAIGCALGHEAGSRLTDPLAISTNADTLLRRVKQLKNKATLPLRFVGINDWAWRKGHRYGTIIVNLERGDVVDLLPDRDAGTVKNGSRIIRGLN
jgi:hypothetical protein